MLSTTNKQHNIRNKLLTKILGCWMLDVQCSIFCIESNKQVAKNCDANNTKMQTHRAHKHFLPGIVGRKFGCVTCIMYMEQGKREELFDATPI